MVLLRERRYGAPICPKLLLRTCVLGVAMLPRTPALHSAMKKSSRGPITVKPNIDGWRNGSVDQGAAGKNVSRPSPEGEAASNKSAASRTEGILKDLSKVTELLKDLPTHGFPPLPGAIPRKGAKNSTRAVDYGSDSRCGKRIEQPPSKRSVNCPAECPYIRPDSVNFCSFACVAKEDCDNRNPLTSFADPETMMCSLCEVPGCELCGIRKDVCARCSEGMELDKYQKCVSKYRTRWHMVYVVLGSIAALVVTYLVILSRRPVVNQDVLQSAEEYRRFSRVSRSSPSGSFRPYPIDTNLVRENVSGIAVLLHFSWQLHVLIWAALMAFSLAVLALCLTHIPGLMAMMRSSHHPSSTDVLQECVDNGKRDAKEAERADRVLLYFVIVVYVASTIGCLLLMARHRYLTQKDDSENDTMMDYAVQAEGLPVASGEANLEDEYTLFFKEAFPDLNIVGVSICWDHTSLDLDLDRVVSLHLAAERQDLECLKKERSPATLQREGSVNRRASLVMTGVPQLLDVHETSRISWCDPDMRCVDALLLGESSGSESVREKIRFRSADLRSALRKMRTAGSVYVVFNTQADRDSALKKPPIFYKDSRIKLTKTDYEPESVEWANKGQWLIVKLARLTGSIAALGFAVWFWASFFYAPWANYVLSWSQVNGMRNGNFAHGTLLGLVITLGNQVMYNLCDRLASWVRFDRKGTRDAVYVCMYTFSIFINTVLDLWMVLVLAYGYDSGAGWDEVNGGVLSAKAVSRNPSIQDALYVELVAYLYPGTLLIPYVVEPLAIWLVPYYLYKWLIRSRHGVSVFDAENYLMAFPFDLCRYGDIVCCLSVCVLVFFVASSQMWIVFVYLASMLVFVYVWDSIRLLRISPRTFCGSSLMDNMGMLLLGFPSGLMASCVVFRLYGLHVQEITSSSVQWDMLQAFALHTVLYVVAWMIISKMISRVEDPLQGKPYAETACGIACNWFNANYAHCLRTRYLHDMDEDDQWCVPFKVGREYLLEAAPNFGCYFETRKHNLKDEDIAAEDKQLFQAKITEKLSGNLVGDRLVRAFSSNLSPRN